ncbi:MAG: L-glyceraldehyde 3-phosphate reductase [Bacteroidales bacterium]|nr:L-glyceraldehyde 3-phosphate reductase [Bacteroidales bacterium]
MRELAYTPDVLRYGNGMKFRRCGKSGIMLPEISLGFWHNFGDVDSFENAEAMVHFAFDHGVCHFDLANNYGPSAGSAERTLGLLMKRSLHAFRDELFISTKAGYDMWPGPYGSWGSRKNLIASLDQSLRRMNLEYVDLFYSHRYDPCTPLEETLQALVDVVRCGKALYVGISRWPKEAAAVAYDYLAAHDVPCLVYQGRYNLLDREPLAAGIIDQAQECGAGFVVFSPLAQGLLAGRYIAGIPGDSRIAHGGHLKREALTVESMRQIKALDLVAKRRGQSLAEMSLAWILNDVRVTSVIVGSSSVAQLQKNLMAMQSPAFTAEELQEIEAVLAR